ncbi:MAG: ATPase domain-containing protein [Candidatus Bathyarchaeota archaeon]
MEDSLSKLLPRLLTEEKQVKFRNERKNFYELIEVMEQEFHNSVSEKGILNEPYGSLAFIITIGQRPITSLLILRTLLETEKPLNGKKIGEKLAEQLGISSDLTTKGGNYVDRVGHILSAFTKIGIIEAVTDKNEKRFELTKSTIPRIEAFIDQLIEGKTQPKFDFLNLKNLFKSRFDKRLSYVIKSGTRKRQPFRIGKIIKSLLDPKLGISFEDAITVVEEIDLELRKGMKTTEIQSLLYQTLKKYNKKAAENYRLSYPKILSIKMSDGKIKTVNYKLVKTLIEKEIRLKLTRNLLDEFASIVYNVISRNPEKYENETAIREYIYALVSSDCIVVRSIEVFVREHLQNANSSLESARDSLESDEVNPARSLLEQFLQQITLISIVEFGYLPFNDFMKNVDLISNLLRNEEIRKELQSEFQLDENEIRLFQRIRFLEQSKNTATKKTLDKMVEECKMLLLLCETMLKPSRKRLEEKPSTVRIPEAAYPPQVTIGYDDLDALLLGGLPKGYATILTSPSCDERDLLIENFLKAGIKVQSITVYITIDAKATAFLLATSYPAQFYLFLCNPEADAIIKDLPNVFKVKGVDNLTDIDIAIATAFRKLDKFQKGSRRACIEIVSDALLQHRAVATRRWLAALLPKFKSQEFTTLAIMNPHMHSSQEVQAILDLFQGEIHVYKKKTEKGMKRFLRIEKMYNHEYKQVELQLKKEKMQNNQ